MSCRKDPAWVNIPLAVEAVSRTSTRAERMEREKKKQAEADKDIKRRKQEAQMAKILAARWAEEDQRRKQGLPPSDRAKGAQDRSRSRQRRRDRDEDEDRGRRRRGASEDRRGGRRGRDEADAGSDDEDAAEKEEQAGAGGWNSFAPPRNAQVFAPLALSKDAPAQAAAAAAPAAKRSKHAQKVAGIFGSVDSDDEEDKRRKEEMEIAKRAKNSRMVNTASQIATPGTSAGPSRGSSAASGGGGQASASDVQMRLSRWKLQCKGKHVDMPPDLRREVEIMMGRG